MKLIVTNDDGIEADGINTLVRLASRRGEVVVVAPAQPQSGVGHTLTTDKPIRVDKLTEERFRVWGTPADCTRLALSQLASRRRLAALRDQQRKQSRGGYLRFRDRGRGPGGGYTRI